MASFSIAFFVALAVLNSWERVNADGETQANNGRTSAAKSTATTLKPVGLEYASPADASAATGHYARSRTMLIAAINEFDKGYRIARPDALINSAAWRASLIDRAEELERLLDPQPRVTERGSRFSPDPRLMGRTNTTK